ncbi:MAG: hypothetical protein FWF67_03860 [Fibromonadales bacterium]|nr:hypothetical protein [Fibromonadales bacterium]
MKIFYKSIVFLFLAFFTANATSNPLTESINKEKGKIADPSALNTKKISVYLHPIILLFGASAETLLLYSTVEVPLSLYNAPIFKPSVLKGHNSTRIGSDFGWRHYLAGRGEGLYLQPQVGMFYSRNWSVSLLSDSNLKDHDDAKKSAWVDGMLYLGESYKFVYVSMFYDVGIGYGRALGKGSLIVDVNIGLGVSF